MAHQTNGTNGVNGANGTNGVNGHSSSAIISPEEFAKQDYDYVIVGGGTAGLAVAARLTENEDVTVGVIEAGKNHLNDMLVDTPAMFLQMFSNPDYDWNFKTTPQAGTMKNPVHHMVRGKMLGGSSGINYMMYVRGSTADYDDWAKIVDDPKWNAQEMKQYMRKHQKLEPIDESVTDRSTMPFVGENHGTSGPIRTSFNPWKLDIEDDIVKACDAASGYDKKPIDPWSGDHIGFYHTLASIARTGPHKGKRSYAARGYLEANLGRPNLHVTTESLVSRVNLVGDKATGVTYKHAGQEYTVKANREVIISGGTINTPQILELSGIGDPAVLSKVGIDCRIENKAVGENFQDHVVIGVCHQTKEGVDTLDSIARKEVLEGAMKAYQEGQTGPIACTSTVQGFLPFNLFATPDEQAATIKSIEDIKDQTPFAKKQRDTVVAHLKDEKSANLQMVTICATLNPVDGHADQSKIFPPLHDPSGPNGITLAGCLQYPVSRGSIHITSSDPEAHPAIDPGYLRHEADVDVMAACVKFLAKAADSEPLKSKLGPRIWPDPKLDLTKTEDCKKAVLGFYIGEYHPCGSVAMGDALDSRLRVKGTRNIRVADASVFPGNVSGNIMSSVSLSAHKPFCQPITNMKYRFTWSVKKQQISSRRIGIMAC